MARDRNNLGRHFIFWYLDELLEIYENSGTITHVVSVDFNDPLKSVIAIECYLLGREIPDD